MHLSDTLVFGPLGPLLPQPVRVRLVALLVGLVGGLAILTLAGIVLVLGPAALPASARSLLPGWASPAEHNATTQQILVSSNPAGAVVLIGGRELGRTPATVSTFPGLILTLRRAGFLDAFVASGAPSADVTLWRAEPEVRLVRPPLPGASITSADFLPDGRVALAIQVPPTGERQAWAYDPKAARTDRLGRADAPGALPNAVAVAPDGVHAAAILHLDGLDGAAADQLSLEGPEGVRAALQFGPLDRGERLLDVSWAPTGEAVLLLSKRPVAGGTRFRLRFVTTTGEAHDLADLPAGPLAGSWIWAPDGHAVAFLVRSQTTALVTLDLTSGELRYLDDLRGDALPSTGAVAPATWQPSGWLLYAAPASTNGTGSGNTGPVLFSVAPGRTDAHRVGDIAPVFAPAVRDDGLLLTLARAENDVLVLRPVDASGHVLAEQRLGVSVSGAYSARWDLAHNQLLIVRAGAGNGVEVMLMRFAAEDRPPASAPSTDP
jgi:hypothetical protein